MSRQLTTQPLTLLLCPACGWCRTVRSGGSAASIACGTCGAPLRMLPRQLPPAAEPGADADAGEPVTEGPEPTNAGGSITEDVAVLATGLRRALRRARIL